MNNLLTFLFDVEIRRHGSLPHIDYVQHRIASPSIFISWEHESIFDDFKWLSRVRILFLLECRVERCEAKQKIVGKWEVRLKRRFNGSIRVSRFNKRMKWNSRHLEKSSFSTLLVSSRCLEITAWKWESIATPLTCVWMEIKFVHLPVHMKLTCAIELWWVSIESNFTSKIPNFIQSAERQLMAQIIREISRPRKLIFLFNLLLISSPS